jgi:hypothetical protein
MPKEPHKQQAKTSNRSQTTKLHSNKNTYQHGKQPNSKAKNSKKGNSLNKTATSRTTTAKGKGTADKHRTLPTAFKTTSTKPRRRNRVLLLRRILVRYWT